MRSIYVWCFAIIFCTYTISCKKSDVGVPSQPLTLIDSSRNFFESDIKIKAENKTSRTAKLDSSEYRSNPRKYLLRDALWEKASKVLLSIGDAVVVPVHFKDQYSITTNISGNNYFSINDLSKLLIYQDAKKTFHAELVNYFPDSNYNKNRRGNFSGLVVVEDWNGNLIKEYKYDGKGRIEKLDLERSRLGQPNRNQDQSNLSIISICYEISGYNYSPVNDEYTYWSYTAGCRSFYIPDGGGGGGDGGPGGGDYGGGGGGGAGGGDGISSSSPFTLVSGPDAINNITEYTKCFTNTPGTHDYNISLCVLQPEEGSRGSWVVAGGGSSGTGNPISVGHTFLILSENSGIGSIVRNVGFYPAGNVTPFSVESQGQLNNDANHEYNISLNISVTSSEFTQVLNFISQGNNIGYMYNLNSNNCTTFAINALGSAGIQIPGTTGSWLNGGGFNPGDLGEDIRGMQLQANMTRTTMSGAHQNVGTCY